MAIALGVSAAPDKENRTATALRSLCQKEEADDEILSAEVRLPPLRYHEGSLEVELSRPVVVEDGPKGMIEVFPKEAESATARMAIEEGARLMREQAQGKLLSRLYFVPQRGPLTATPCLALSGGRMTRIRVQPLWVSLEAKGQKPVSLYTKDGKSRALDGRPEAKLDLFGLVYDGETSERDAVIGAVRPLQERAQVCYQSVLAQRPGLSGRVVLGMDSDKDGRLSEARIELDSTSDKGLVRCLKEAAGTLRLARIKRAAHLSVPVVLSRAVD